MKKNLITATCTGLGIDGKGYFRYQGKEYACSNFLPLEKAEIDIQNQRQPKLVNLLEASKHRILPKCEKYQQCGGCQLLHMDFQAQQDFKTESVKKVFAPLKHMMKTNIPTCIMANDPWYYRNKIQMPVA